VPAFSSDGLRHYFSALTAHYGFQGFDPCLLVTHLAPLDG
jgi:hypothetical protein